MLKHPFPFMLLNPVTRYSQISIWIWGLPCICGQANFTLYMSALGLQLEFMSDSVRSDKQRPTLRWSLSAIICFLKLKIILSQVCFQFGILAPFIMHEATDIICLNWLVREKKHQGWISNRQQNGTWLVSISHWIAASLKTLSVYGVGFSSSGMTVKWSSTCNCFTLSAAVSWWYRV